MKTMTEIVYLALAVFVLTCFALSPQARAVCQDGCDLVFQNTFLGEDALVNNTTGPGNTAIGFEALLGNTTGQANTASGFQALSSNTVGFGDTGVGWKALFANTSGTANTACGETALFSNTTGYNNTAVGAGALLSNTTGYNNTGNGVDSLISNTTGFANTAVGVIALNANTTGANNAAGGFGALQSNTTGSNNTGVGYNALAANTTPDSNTALGNSALGSNTIGANNIAVGDSAGINLTTGNNNIDIGNKGIAGESKRIRIGSTGVQTKTFIAGIRGVTTQNANAVPVLIDSAGQLGTVSSSRRFKKEIKAMDQTSEAILGLRPVMFYYKSDSSGTPQFGNIAEEVAEVNPDLVVRDENGEIYTVRYEAVNAMLLNEFLKEHRKVEALQAAVAEQRNRFESKFAEQEKQIAVLASDLQKVSVQLEIIKPAQRVVANDP